SSCAPSRPCPQEAANKSVADATSACIVWILFMIPEFFQSYTDTTTVPTAFLKHQRTCPDTNPAYALLTCAHDYLSSARAHTPTSALSGTLRRATTPSLL